MGRWAAGVTVSALVDIVILRWDATHRSNTAGTCGGYVRPDESKGSPSLDEMRLFRVIGSSGFEFLDLGVRNHRFDGDLHSVFHGIFEGHFDSEQAVLVDRFSFVRFHWPG